MINNINYFTLNNLNIIEPQSKKIIMNYIKQIHLTNFNASYQAYTNILNNNLYNQPQNQI